MASDLLFIAQSASSDLLFMAQSASSDLLFMALLVLAEYLMGGRETYRGKGI